MGAVRVALFDDKEHRDQVAKAWKKAHIKKLLILGTSEKMVMKIATRLQLPQPQKIIHIEEIASREEIEKAIKSQGHSIIYFGNEQNSKNMLRAKI